MFTEREAAARVFAEVRGFDVPIVHPSKAQVAAHRLAILTKCERACHAALDGPERRFIGEPDDATLRAMLADIDERRSAMANRAT